MEDHEEFEEFDDEDDYFGFSPLSPSDFWPSDQDFEDALGFY